MKGRSCILNYLRENRPLAPLSNWAGICSTLQQADGFGVPQAGANRCHNSYMSLQGSPTYTKITNAVPTLHCFGLCMCKWGIFALVESWELSHLRKFWVPKCFSSPKSVFLQSEKTKKIMVISIQNSCCDLILFIGTLVSAWLARCGCKNWCIL